MGGGYKIKDRYAMYFVTFQIVYWIDLFSRQEYRDAFLDSLSYCRQHKGLKVHAYVIMSNHVHLILSATEPLNDLSTIIGHIKSYTSREFIKIINEINESRKDWMLKLLTHAASKQKRNTQYQIWTHENHPIILDNEERLSQRMEYIHENPVKAGMVEKAEDYLYSSARNYTGLFSIIGIDKLDVSFPGN